MKNRISFCLLTLSQLAFASQSAFATTSHFICQEPMGSNRAKRYELKFELNAPSMDSFAFLKVPGEAAPRKLDCVSPAIDPVSPGMGRHPGAGDQYYPVATCSERIADAGYAVNIQAGGLLGLTTATIYEKNFYKNKVVDQLFCRRSDIRPPG